MVCDAVGIDHAWYQVPGTPNATKFADVYHSPLNVGYTTYAHRQGAPWPVARQPSAPSDAPRPSRSHASALLSSIRTGAPSATVTCLPTWQRRARRQEKPP